MKNIKTILITGASTGLGRATAEYFAQQGWNVIATMRNPERMQGFDSMSNLYTVPLDVTKESSIQLAIDEAVKLLGRIDVVVNNAGVGVYGALELVSPSDIDQQYEVNIKGVINVIRAMLPHFRHNRSGKFINVSSLMGLSTALPLGSLYNMSKFALEGLTEGLYFELKPLNISLHLVEPGGFASKFSDNVTMADSDVILDYKGITNSVKNIMAASSKPGALPPPDDIVQTIFDLASGKRNSFRNVVGKDAKQVLFIRKLLPLKTFLNILFKRVMSANQN